MKSIAFFGATGGCTLNCLIPALQAGYRCSALVRSPQKLHALLHQHNVTNSTNLAVIQGSIDDHDAVRRTLIVASSSSSPAQSPPYPPSEQQLQEEEELVDIIVSGVGGTPRFDNPLRPTLDNPTICQDAIRAVLDACRAALQDSSPGAGAGAGAGSTARQAGDHTAPTTTPRSSKKKNKKRPYLVVVSTTGIAAKRDIPIAMIPLYHWLLRVPHEDKRVMEELVRAEMRRDKEESLRALRSYTIVRPSLLTNGESIGLDKIRFGVDEDAAVGYTISRKDVGGWMFERLVEGEAGDGGEFARRVVSLTA